MPNTDQIRSPTSRSLVVSVPHSGTRFLKQLLGGCNACHSMSDWCEVIHSAKRADHIYVPMRHPHDVWTSWCRRRRLSSANQIMLWHRSWYQLHALDMMFDLDIVCVDKDERVTKNPVVGHDPGYSKFDLVDVSLNSLWELPIVNRHYERR